MRKVVNRLIGASALIACTSGISGATYIPSFDAVQDENGVYALSVQQLPEFAVPHSLNCSCGCCS